VQTWRGCADLLARDILFAAHRYVSNGWIPSITHVVDVDPEAYANLPTTADLRAVSQAVSKLNKLLPKRAPFGVAPTPGGHWRRGASWPR
jgi:hypothetical protein